MIDLLAGITVLDLSSVGPAARAAGWLADYGADVVKVWAPKGSNAQITPPAHAYSGGRGTRRIRLDLKSPDGREEFLRLAESADVVIESFRPGVVARLGIGYDDVKGRNPAIVYCQCSGFGSSGPYSAVPSYGGMMEALAGAHNMTMGDDGLMHRATRTGFGGTESGVWR